MSEYDFDHALIAAAFRLAAESGWVRVTIADAARAASLSLAEARVRFPGKHALLRRFGHAVPAEAEFEQPAATLTGSLLDIFTPAYRRDTFGLFGAFFFCLMTVYLALQLLVTVLKGTGFTPQRPTISSLGSISVEWRAR